MKQLHNLLLLSFFLPASLKAQYIADNRTHGNNRPAIVNESASPTPQWSKDEDRINGRIAKPQLKSMRAVTDSIISFFQGSCFSEGQYNFRWHGEYSSEKVSAAPQMKFSASCNIADTKASLSIIANDISALTDHVTIDNRDFLAIAATQSVKNECPYFELKAQEEGSQHSRFWLITTDSKQLPFIPLTRKDYLAEAKSEINNIKKSILAELNMKMPIRSQAEQAAEKKLAIDQLNATYSGSDLQMRIRMLERDSHTDEEYQKVAYDKATVDLDATLHLMDSLLTHIPAQELDRPAMVSRPAAEFTGFTDNAEDKMLIRMNPVYFSPYLGSEKPQLFLVTWNFDPSDATAKELDRQLQEKFSPAALRPMLGK